MGRDGARWGKMQQEMGQDGARLIRWPARSNETDNVLKLFLNSDVILYIKKLFKR
jgi:hypothetical protein